MLTKLQTLFSFSDYQIAQLKYLLVIIFTDLSKLIIMGFIFKNCFISFLYSVLLLSVLRLTTGGLHCASYLGCFFTTFLFLYLSLDILPLVKLPTSMLLFFLCICALTNFIIGPISSEKRLSLKKTTKQRLAYQSLFIISIHIILLLCFNNQILVIGSWLIIMHTLQLIIANHIKSREEVKS